MAHTQEPDRCATEKTRLASGPLLSGLNLKSLDKTAVEELPTANGPADYALFVGGRCLGIIEAKKVAVNPQNVLEQAKRYARGVSDAVGEWNGFRVPFLYARNGAIIWHVDTRPDKIVRRVEGLFALADQIEARYAKAKAHVEKLTQSILAKAFRGELVPQDPKDEPAEKLSEQLRQARNGKSKPAQRA